MTTQFGKAMVDTDEYKEDERAKTKVYRNMIDNLEDELMDNDYSSGQLSHPDEATVPDYQSPVLAACERLQGFEKTLEDMTNFVEGRMNDVVGIAPPAKGLDSAETTVDGSIVPHYKRLTIVVNQLGNKLDLLDSAIRRMKEL